MNSQKTFRSRIPLTVVLAIALCPLFSPVLATGQEDTSGGSNTEANNSAQKNKAELDENLLEMASTLVWDSIEVLKEHHVNPPLPNQIILNGIERLFPGQGRGLYEDVAKIKTKEDLKAVVRLAFKQSKKARETNPQSNLDDPVVLANLFMASVPGSPQVVTAYQAGINRQLAENRYVGIGIALLQEQQYALISVPFRGGPAQKAGILHGDRIIKVDGKSMVGKPLGEVVMALRGPKDSDVNVVVSQPGKKEREYQMTRGVVPISSVKGVKEQGETDWEFAFPENKNVAYVEVTDISGSTAAELRNALRQIERQKFDSLVIDFRNCFRGDLHHITMVADVLIASDNLGHWTDAKGKTHPLKLRKVNQLPDLPISLIVSPAQSNEIKLLIAGLAHHRDATVVGQINPSPIRIRGNPKIPSGSGTLSNVFIGTASLRLNSNPSGHRPDSRLSQSNRFRSGIQKEMDGLIRQAIEKSEDQG